METIISIKPLLAVAVSLFGSLLIILCGRKPNLRESCSITIALIKFGIIISMLPVVLAGKKLAFTLVEVLPGVGIAFRVDSFGMLFALVASSLWIVTTI
ncbi:MAG: hypothetical protein Q7J01_07935, partial [Syntrophales bacterium]|nr:hypothetical protein [Syntrophales bacterium]